MCVCAENLALTLHGVVESNALATLKNEGPPYVGFGRFCGITKIPHDHMFPGVSSIERAWAIRFIPSTASPNFSVEEIQKHVSKFSYATILCMANRHVLLVS